MKEPKNQGGKKEYEKRVPTGICSFMFTLLLFSVITLILLPTSSAKVEIFDEWVAHQDTFPLENTEFSFFVVDETLEKAKLQAGRYGTLFLNKGSTDEEGILSVEYLGNRKKDIPSESTDKRDQYEYHVLITKEDGPLEVDRGVDSSNTYYLDTIEFTITLENKENLPIKRVKVTQPLPDELIKMGTLEVTKIRNGKSTTLDDDKLTGNDQIVWNGLVREDEQIILKQSAKIIKKEKEEIKIPSAEVTYHYEQLSFETKTNDKTIQQKDPLEIKIEPSTTNPTYGDRVKYLITLTNKHRREALTVSSFIVTTPEKTTVYSSSTELKEIKGTKQMKWLGEIEKEHKKTLTLELEIFGSENLLEFKSQHNFEGKEFTKEESTQAEIGIKNMETEIQSNKIHYEGEEEASIKFYIENVNAKIPFQNIKVKIRSKVLKNEDLLFNLAPRENKLIKKYDLTLPNVEEETTDMIEMSGTYETAYGEVFEFQERKMIVIEPTKEMLRALQERENSESPDDDNENREGTITISTGTVNEDEDSREDLNTEEETPQNKEEKEEVQNEGKHEEKKKDHFWTYFFLVIILGSGIVGTIIWKKEKYRLLHHKHHKNHPHVNKDHKKEHEHISKESNSEEKKRKHGETSIQEVIKREVKRIIEEVKKTIKKK